MTTSLIERAQPLRLFVPVRQHWVWFVGCHGGAGESTLSSLLPASGAAEHRWPIGGAVVLVARTSATGLLAARAALQQWVSPDGPRVNLLGLVLSADAPGHPPRALADLTVLVAGGAPRAWHVPWVPAWRTGDLADQGITKRLFADLASLTAPKEHLS